MHKTLDIISVPVKSSANTINKVIEINGCIKSNDKNIFSHALKNHAVELFISVRSANGMINIRTFTIINLREYVNNKFMKLIEIKLCSIPSKENMFKLVLSTVTTEFKFDIREEKEISSPNILLPILLIASDIRDVKYINISHIK